MVWQWVWGSHQQQRQLCLTHGGLWGPHRIHLPRPHWSTPPTGQDHVFLNISRRSPVCHTCSAWTCPFLWGEPVADGKSVNSGVLWQIPISVWPWAQTPLADIRPSWSMFLTVWVKHACVWPAGGHFVRLWPWPTSSLCKGADNGLAARLAPFYAPPTPTPHTTPRHLLHTLETTRGNIANCLAAARIDAPSWRSCATWTTSVGCRYLILIPTIIQKGWGEGNGMWPQAKPFLNKGCLANCLTYL